MPVDVVQERWYVNIHSRGTVRTPARRLGWLAAAVAALAPLLAGAAEIVTLEDECRGRQLMIRGVIEPGDHQRLVRRLAALVSGEGLPDVQDPETLWTVKLDSPGGDLDEAMRIGRFLRGVLATTEASYRYARRPDGVWDLARSAETVCLEGDDRLAGCQPDVVEAECTGACLLIWLGGAERYAHEGRLGVHGLAGDDTEAVRAYLRELEVAEPWIRRIHGPVDGDGWLLWRERRELGGRAPAVAALIADCPASLTREESFQSVTAASAALRDRLMDRAEAHRQCRVARIDAARSEALALLRQAGGGFAAGH